MSDLVGNPEDRFSRVTAQINLHTLFFTPDCKHLEVVRVCIELPTRDDLNRSVEAAISSSRVCITKTCPCNIQRFFSEAKIESFIEKNLKIFLFLLKT